MSSIKKIPIKFNLRFFLVLALIELVTVPLVAMSNPWLTNNLITVSVLGFAIAAFGLAVLFNLIRRSIMKHSYDIFLIDVVEITNLWLIVVIAGILEMIMFIVQNSMFEHDVNVFIVGFISAITSVFCALVVYRCIVMLNLAIRLVTPDGCYSLNIPWTSIIYLSFLFGLYEFVVCPITGWWIPYHGLTRFFIAVCSAVIGVTSGFCVMKLFIKVTKIKIYFYLFKHA